MKKRTLQHFHCPVCLAASFLADGQEFRDCSKCGTNLRVPWMNPVLVSRIPQPKEAKK